MTITTKEFNARYGAVIGTYRGNCVKITGVSATGTAAANSVQIAALGSDTNVSIGLLPKGTGVVNIGLTTNIIIANGNGSTRIQSDGANIMFSDVVMPPQAATASSPAYIKGGMYFDTTLNKLQIGGATAWENIGGSSGATITDDNLTNITQYIGMARVTSGSWTTAYTASTNLYFNPLSGTLNSVIFNSLSDARKKTNINLISDALHVVEHIRGVTFDWLETGLPSAGLIAQDVEMFLPELMSTHGDTKSLNYNGVIGVLVEAIKELSDKVRMLENR